MASSYSSSLHLPTFTLWLWLFLTGMASAQLTNNFYAKTCPNFRSVIQRAVNSAVSSEARMGASLLRLHFHDCFVNASLHFIISFFISLDLGGPSWNVAVGRRDSTTASLSAANSNIPGPTLSLSGLITAFSNKGFTAKEMVALSGSHTIGQARCTTFRTRLYNENVNSSLATSLKANCPSSGGDNNLSPLDPTSPTSFDNAYFKNLQIQKGLLHSDQQLFSGGSTDAQVNTYSSNSATFLTDFANAMVKMSNLSPLTGSNGQIRSNCRKTN
ncbi:hypothetical protein RJ639_005989 [Escallonia herrerae]|uniref:peroxidase n=1 Tax=Escallonia herrerae TaxID=1293975 RepID=A0AA88W014_9ASTE|nr:hypothetical protein RJ639_005989 [Escallonia herrerae]